MNTAAKVWLGLGSNQDGPVRQVQAAIDAIGSWQDCRLLAQSRLFKSRPWGVLEQADFVNAVVQIESSLHAIELLDRCQALETAAGRNRSGLRWGPRVLDVDLLMIDEMRLSSRRLTLPHPHMHRRVFVLLPMLDIDPDASIPGQGAARLLLAGLDDDLPLALTDSETATHV